MQAATASGLVPSPAQVEHDPIHAMEFGGLDPDGYHLQWCEEGINGWYDGQPLENLIFGE